VQKIFINGTWVHGHEGQTHDICNPATLEVLGTVSDCGSADVTLAVAAARAAQREWRNVPAAARARLLSDIAGRIRARERELAALLTRESGKPLCESVDCVRTVAALHEIDFAPPQATGVIAVVLPFNFPLLLMACSVARAIAAGNAVVCKPAPRNPLTTLALTEVYEALPAGVVNVITGGADTGRALTRHADVDRVTFTGSAAVGRRIAADVQHKELDLELGGVDAFIVCHDADLDLSVPSIAWARLQNGGQACTTGKHIYVERSIADEFVERMHQCVGFLDVDDPLKRSTDLGPLICLEAAHRVEDQVGRSLREGATLVLGGRRFRPCGLPGHFFQPTILADVRPGSLPTREEILGPVVTITPVSHAIDAIRAAGDPAGAARASLFTRDPAAVIHALGSVERGVLRINDPATNDFPGPFGSMRHGGLCHPRPTGNTRVAQGTGAPPVAAAPGPKSWWFPYGARPLPEA
jgi:betaine-aldehyde dehydrogenase